MLEDNDIWQTGVCKREFCDTLHRSKKVQKLKVTNVYIGKAFINRTDKY